MPAIELSGLPEGSKSDILSYSVQEDATTNDVSTNDGAYGQVTFTVDDFKDSHLLLGDVVTLSDGSRGKFQSVVRGVSGLDGALTLTGDSVLSRFNAWVTVAPYQGDLGGYVTALCAEVGLGSTNPIEVDPSITGVAVTAPGFVGNLWDHLKMFLAANQVELAQVYTRIVVRPLRTLDAFTGRTTSEGYDLNAQTTAETVEIVYYNHAWGSQPQAYPTASEPSPAPLVVNANQALVQPLAIEGSLLSVNQPTVQNFVNNTSYAGTNGVYAVSGSDGLPITAAQWTAKGGKVLVEITEDPSVLQVTVTGADIPELSPFRIAMSSGSSTYYSALRITGTGTLWDKRTLTLRTGAPPSATGEVVGVTVDNPYISTLAQAYTAGLIVAGAYAGPTYTVSGSTFALNRPNSSNTEVFSTFEEFNAANAGTTFSDFNTYWGVSSFNTFDAYWDNLVQSRFSNQLFGQGIGARLKKNEAYFRITSTTTGPVSVEYSARLDTTFSDFATALSGKTFGDFNLIHIGKTFNDFTPIPLRAA